MNATSSSMAPAVPCGFRRNKPIRCSCTNRRVGQLPCLERSTCVADKCTACSAIPLMAIRSACSSGSCFVVAPRLGAWWSFPIMPPITSRPRCGRFWPNATSAWNCSTCPPAVPTSIRLSECGNSPVGYARTIDTSRIWQNFETLSETNCGLGGNRTTNSGDYAALLKTSCIELQNELGQARRAPGVGYGTGAPPRRCLKPVG